MMSNQASDRLQQKATSIMQLWEQRARAEVSASQRHDSLVLQDSLPLYLNQLVDALSTRIDRTSAQIEADKIESTRIGNKHGRDRAGYADYSISQVIFEYHILRQVIFQVLEAEAPLGVRERDIIIGSIEQAVNDAATQFSRTLRDIQELFVATLTHDLRGSITIVKMGTHLILRRLEQEDVHIDDVAARMIGAVDRMDAMIQNLLDASYLRAGQHLKLDLEECNLDLLVQDIVADLRFTYGERFVVGSDSTIRSNCSPKELRRVIENLAINAVKYGAPDTPITLTLLQTATQISLTIHNEGKPIALDAQAILFQQFRRTTAEDETGWGLGLFLAKSIIEAHQGTIAVESAPGKGTSFIVKLPKVFC